MPSAAKPYRAAAIRRVRAHKSRVSKAEGSTKFPILALPDDMLILIFEKLSTAERAHLALVCRRFREIDLKIGKRVFNHIAVVLQNEIDGMAETYSLMQAEFSEHAKPYGFRLYAGGNFVDEYPDINEFFKNATAESIHIIVDENVESGAAQSLASIYQSITYEKLYLCFTGSTDYSDFFVSLFENFKNIPLDGVFLDLGNLNNHNIPRVLQALKTLPELDKLHVINIDNDREQESDEYFIADGAVMLQLISSSTFTYFEMVKCTVEELLTAFKMVIASDNPSKKVVIKKVNCAVVDEMFALAVEKYGFEATMHPDGYTLFDPTNRFRFDVPHNGDAMVAVRMQRHSEDDEDSD